MNIRLIERDGMKPDVPKYQTAGAAGMDLAAFVKESVTIEAGGRAKVPTGIAIELPDENCAGFVMGRSSQGAKYGVCPANGVGLIDSDYRGEIFVTLQNNGSEDFIVNNGDRIAQLVIVNIRRPELVVMDKLSDTVRGEGGFGSTNK